MHPHFSSAAFKFFLIYLIVGISWIIFSDLLLFNISGSLPIIEFVEFNSVKGILFVIVTSIIIYLLIRKYEISNYKLFKEINDKNETLSQNQVKLEEYSQQLKEWKERYETVLLASDKILYDYNSESNKIIFGGAISQILGYATDEIDNTIEWWIQKIHEEDKSSFINQVKRTQSTGENFSLEYRVRKKTGEYLYVDDKGYLIKKPNSESFRVIGLVKDVTYIKNHQKLVMINEKRYRHLVENLPAGAVLVEKEKLFFNKAIEKITGYSQQEINTLNDWFKCLYDERSDAVRELYEEDKLNGFKEPRTINILTKSGEVKHLIFVAYVFEDNEVWLVQDVTQQKKMEEKVLSSIILGEDRERKRVAKELHDGLGQYLTAANLNLNSVKKEIHLLPENQKKQFLNGLSFLNEAIEETRNIAQNLMPKAIDDYGLVVALESMLDKLRIITSVDIEFIHNIHDFSLPKNLEINLYRIIQELVNNALKHSSSGKITIQIMKHFDIFILTYEDNGVGFEPDETDASEGLGLLNIKNRILSMGGTIDIDSIKGKGTNIVVSIPYLKNLLVKEYAN